MARETVLEARAGGVLRLTLNRPAQKNAFNTVQWREARDALRDARGDDSVRAVLVTGAGSAFSAGQDLSEMAQSTTAPAGSTAATRSASSWTSCASSTSRSSRP